MPASLRVCVYCGSSVGARPAFRAAAQALGETLARRGVGLVYGGGHVGLMGVLADAVLTAGGEVIGVITERLVAAEVAHRGLTSLEVVPDMHQRKARFEQLAAGFIVLPGGFGTLDEAFEMLTWNQLGLVHKPVVFLEVEAYWAPLFAWADRAVDDGFVRAGHRALVQQASTVDDALNAALGPAPEGLGGKWLSGPQRG